MFRCHKNKMAGKAHRRRPEESTANEENQGPGAGGGGAGAGAGAGAGGEVGGAVGGAVGLGVVLGVGAVDPHLINLISVMSMH